MKQLKVKLKAIAKNKKLLPDYVMLIVGLGNPGSKYKRTRHNIGFRLVDLLCDGNEGRWKAKYKGDLSDIRLGSQRVWLLKPETYMNASGESVLAALSGLRKKPEDILIVHDELDLPFGTLKLKSGGGHGGNNGIRSVIEHIGSTPFGRLRFGIGHPGKGADVAGHVLNRFSEEEENKMPEMLNLAAEIAERWVADGIEEATRWLHTEDS